MFIYRLIYWICAPHIAFYMGISQVYFMQIYGSYTLICKGTNYRCDPPMYTLTFVYKFDIFLQGLNVIVQFCVALGSMTPDLGLIVI